LLQSLAELNLLLVRSLDSEELNSVLPERQTIYLCVEHLQSGTLHYLKQFVDVLNVDGDVVDGTVRHCCLAILISLYHEIVELQESHFL